jgi:hypothetical protein
MSKVNPPFRLDPHRWGTILGTLSLDMVAPCISDMGLQLPPGDDFRAGLRDIIGRFRALEGKDANAETSFAPAVFQWVSARFGSPFARHLYAWGENVFHAGKDGADVFAWNNIVRRGGLDGARDTHAPPEFIKLLRAKLAERQRPAVNRIAPSSPWDRELYERHGYGRFESPMELVQAAIQHHNFLDAWGQAVQETGAKPDVSELRKWGLREAQELGMPLERVSVPGSWRPLPARWT